MVKLNTEINQLTENINTLSNDTDTNAQRITANLETEVSQQQN